MNEKSGRLLRSGLKHSEPPFELKTSSGDANFLIVGSDGLVARCAWRPNAEFVLLACNAYRPLMDALQQVRIMLDRVGNDSLVEAQRVERIEGVIRQALKTYADPNAQRAATPEQHKTTEQS